MKVLEAKNLTKIFPGVTALDGINISFEKGRIHCIVGENGAGKSTLIKCLTGVYKADEGEIYINGRKTNEDADRVFRVVERQREAGIAVVYISHKLNEIFRIGDDITVFRNGQKIDTALVNEINEDWIIRKMIGKHLSGEQRFYSDAVTDEELLRVEHLYGCGFRDISFTLKKGEILGFSGLIGAGRSELMRAVYGSDRIYSGEIYYKNRRVRQNSAAKSVASGIVYLPEDRKRTGILPLMSVKGNISILSIKELVVHGMVSQRREEARAQEFAKLYDVRTPGLDRKIKTLSGGNQQKAIIARSMLANPQVIILDEPTKGIDVGAKYEIYRLMKTLAENGLGVIFVSSELDEILRCCNRILVMHEERLAGEFSKDPNKEQLMNAMIGRQAQGN